MAAFLYSVKQVMPDLRYELSAGSGIAFVLGAAFSWLLLRLAFKLDDSSAGRVEAGGFFGIRGRRRLFLGLSVLLSLATAGAFALALKGVGNEQLLEVVQGTVIALFALCGVGFLLWRCARFLEKDSQRTAQAKQDRQDNQN
jgi:cytochrome bd-type quinol oxidase subunit 2